MEYSVQDVTIFSSHFIPTVKMHQRCILIIKWIQICVLAVYDHLSRHFKQLKMLVLRFPSLSAMCIVRNTELTIFIYAFRFSLHKSNLP